MGTITCQKNRKICAFCKHWNGTIGSTTMVPINATTVRFNNDEKQKCWINANMKLSTFTCSKFESRY